MDIVITALMGMLISFLGQLPLGSMSITATQIGLEEGYKKAWEFSFGVVIVEMLYLRVALSGMSWVMEHNLFFQILNWLAIAMFFTLGIISFVQASKQTEKKKPLLLNNKVNRFVLGLTMSAVNPLQIPFWFGWSIWLMNNNLLQAHTLNYNFFTLGAGCGTVAGLAVYIHAGKWIVNKLKASNKGMNKFMGIIFIISALIQLYNVVIAPALKKGR